MRFPMLVLCAMSLLCAVVSAQEAVFDAAQPDAPGGITLSGDALRHEVDGMAVVSPPPNPGNYLDRSELKLCMPAAFPANPQEAYLIIEHLDTHLSRFMVVSPCADGIAGTVGLGSGKPRRALYRLSAPAFGAREGADIVLCGMAGIRRVIVKTALEAGERDAIVAEMPANVPPRVALSRPMDLVMAVGTDASTPEGLAGALKNMRELCPLAAGLGFNGVESYVKWNFVEPEKGRFDWSYYDAVVAEAAAWNLKWFPLLIVGSAYTLPGWYHDSPENEGFACLEHGKSNNIQSIFCENQTPYVRAFLSEFGRHYEPGGRLLGVRLGPSGNFGESQYPAGGNWGYAGAREHIHIGWWAGDKHAAPHFVKWLRNRYNTIEALNAAWGDHYAAWEDITSCYVPQFAETPRKRKDIVDWYMGAMTDWCERWALWAREAMPNTAIYQSSGGWGFVESGTDFTEQTRSMRQVHGGIRATNETDSYLQNFQVTRMMSSAARFYGVPFGSEPAGFNSAKGVASRVFNILVNNGQHLFFYCPNLFNNDQAIQTWLDVAPLLDQRAEPVIDVAVLYPDTLSTLDDGVFRNLYASSFYQRVGALRPHLDFDYCSERMIADGALPRYKALVIAWSSTVEAAALNAIDQWVREGGTVLAMSWDRMPLQTVEEDKSVLQRWQKGDTGKGRVVLIREDREPSQRFADRVRDELRVMPGLHPLTRAMLETVKPAEVYVSALRTGDLAMLNYTDKEATVTVPGMDAVRIAPYRITILRP